MSTPPVLLKTLTSSITALTAFTQSGSNRPVVDFNDEVSVALAHEAIQTATDTHLPTTYFRGGAEAQCREAIATLVLCELAQQNEATPAFIPGSREAALVTLVQDLSNTGKKELMRCADEKAVSNAFSEHLALSDIKELRFRRWSLSEAQGYERAGLHCTAAKYYEGAGLHDLAAQTLERLAEKARAAHQYEDAASAYLRGGKTLVRGGQLESADKCFAKVESIFINHLGVPEVEDQKQKRAQCLSEAERCMTAGQDYEAAKYYEAAGLPDLAAQILVRFADQASAAKKLADAAASYLEAAEVFMRAGQPTLADPYFRKGNHIAHNQLGAPELSHETQKPYQPSTNETISRWSK